MVKRLVAAALAAGALLAHGEEVPPAYQGVGPVDAFSYTLLATVVPVAAGILIIAADQVGSNAYLAAAVGLGGIIVGPSTGEFLAGSHAMGWAGVAFRGAGMALFLHGIDRNLESRCGPDDNCVGGSGDGEISLGTAMLLVGTLGGFVDALLAPERARKAAERGRMGLAPMLSPGPDVTLNAGILAWMRF